jgi:surfeit locus 1 family protein
MQAEPKYRPPAKGWHKYWHLPLTRRLILRINPWVTLAFVMILAIMLRLGDWQIDRRALKLAYNAEVEQFLAKNKGPLSFAKALEAFEEQGRRASDVLVTLTGQFADHPIIFHDNRVHQTRAGLHALAVFNPEDASLPSVIVNLGWLPWPSTGRPNLPQFALPRHTLSLSGTLFAPNPETWSLEQIPPPPTQQGWLLQKLNLAQISTEYASDLAPFSLRLTPDSMPETASTRIFRATTDWAMTPDKHLGYAVQWFAMALVLTGIFIGVNLRYQPAK